MVTRLTLKNHSQEIHTFRKRVFNLSIIIIVLSALILARLVYLQIDNNKFYTTLSKKNQLSLKPSMPKRGLIYDRNGKLLAENIPAFSLSLIPEQITNLDDTIKQLKNIIKLSDDEIQRFQQQLKQRRHFDSVPLRLKLTETEVAQLYVNKHHLPGIVVASQLIRHYPLAENTVDVLGYVGRINRNDQTYLQEPNYMTTKYIGKLGVEKFYERLLHGKIGFQQVETNANGRTIRILKEKTTEMGANLYLTIDSNLQQQAKQALANYRGAIVALDPNNGEVLAMASNPSYDPNLFVTGMSNKTFNSLQQSPAQPLFNRTVRGQYALASTIKPFLALGALAENIITPEYRIKDKGWFQLGKNQHIYHDWKRNGHGWTNLNKAIIVSCNTYFYDLSVKLGIKRIHDIMLNFGFGKITGIDLNEELPGVIPDPQWKLLHKGNRWYTGDTILSGIGHGYVLTTPLQLAVGSMALANRGQIFQPHLVRKIHYPNKQPLIINPVELPPIIINTKHWRMVIDAMQKVITDPHGTGFRFGKPAYSIAAKTGTAQLESNNSQHKNNNLRDNSIFIAFAPVQHPRIAIAVVIENDPHAPNVARKIIDSYLLKEK